MNLENYKILKLSNKEMIICEMSSESPDSYEIINPLKMDVMPRMSANGEVNEVLNLRPWLQHISEQKYISVNKSHCIIIVDASVGLSRYYEHFIRKIEHDDLTKISLKTGITIEEIRQKLFIELSEFYELNDWSY